MKRNFRRSRATSGQSMSLTKLKVDELRKRLKDKGLATKGTKPILIARLQEAIDKEGVGEGIGTTNGKDVDNNTGKSDTKTGVASEKGAGDTVTEGKKEMEMKGGGDDGNDGGELKKTTSNLDGLKAADGLSFEERMKKRRERFAMKDGGEKVVDGGSKKEGDAGGKRTRIGSVEVDEEEKERRRKRAAKFGLGDKSAKDVLKEDLQLAKEKAKAEAAKAKEAVKGGKNVEKTKTETKTDAKTENGKSKVDEKVIGEDQKKAMARKERFQKEAEAAKKRSKA